MNNALCNMNGAEFPLFAFSQCRYVVAAVSRAAPVPVDRYEHIVVERRGRLLEITINLPGSRSPLDSPAHKELAHVFDVFFNDSELWAAIITGAASDAFCAGNHLRYSSRNPVCLPTRRGLHTSRRSRQSTALRSLAAVDLPGM